MGQGSLKSAVLDTSFVPCILNELRKAALSLFHCLLNHCLTIFKLILKELIIMWQIKCTIQCNCFLHLFSLMTNKYPTVHVILLFLSVWKFKPYAQDPCRTNTVGPHGYGLANFRAQVILFVLSCCGFGVFLNCVFMFEIKFGNLWYILSVKNPAPRKRSLFLGYENI